MNEYHGQIGTRLYNIWNGMKQRCHNENSTSYDNYGGRGIVVCDEWRNSFTSFFRWAESTAYDDTLSIDRIDNDGNYEPSNCRWATWEQQNNNRRSSRWVDAFGERRTIQDWTRDPRCKVGKRGLAKRLNRGWPAEEAITAPGRRGVNSPFVRALPEGLSCPTEGCANVRERRGEKRRATCNTCRVRKAT